MNLRGRPGRTAGMAEARVLIPRLTSPSGMRWVTATAVAVAGVLAYGWTMRPADRWAVVAIGVLLAVGSVWAVSQRTWIEPSTGTVIRSAFWCLRRRIQLRAATVSGVVARQPQARRGSTCCVCRCRSGMRVDHILAG